MKKERSSGPSRPIRTITSGSRLEAVLLSIAAMDGMGGVKQEFPNIPAEIVFENDQVVAQRITTDPDQWAGEHSHAGGQVVVMLKGGRVTYREGGTETSVTYEDGEVFWIEPTEAHDHVVTSAAAIEAVLVAIK